MLLVLAITLVGMAEMGLRDATTDTLSVALQGSTGDGQAISLGADHRERPMTRFASISQDVGVGGTAVLQSTAANVLAAPIPGSPVYPGPPVPVRYTGGAIGDTYFQNLNFIP